MSTCVLGVEVTPYFLRNRFVTILVSMGCHKEKRRMAAETFRNLVADREIHRRVRRRADLRVHQRDPKGLYAKAQAGKIKNNRIPRAV